MKPVKQPNKRKGTYRAIARYSGLGVEMAVAVIGSAMLGQHLDKRAGHATPVYTLVFCFLGVLYIFYRIFKISASE
ncbi:MAG: AtpZ/AtpI family protein [Bacteroidetes bacterium]|nr:AtpZ/AtpI family protein [Bacteroidota bacterium]